MRSSRAAWQWQASFARYADAARLAHSLGLGVNAGHDLDLANLVLFRTLPHLAEVSIGHALVSHALFVGLDRSVREYLAVLVGVGRYGCRWQLVVGSSDSRDLIRARSPEPSRARASASAGIR